jgi:response regulator RpfG family c-di-GMP phosphodiesterase
VSKPKILCVDDEPNVLAGLALVLHRDFEVLQVTSGEAALAMLAKTADVAVVVSDMRMPKMTGAVLLAQVRERYPEVSRVLLTGQADMPSAISAINDGQIFRFLTKPCDQAPLLAALRAALDHHRLVTAERVLLRDTLHGSIAALVDILALANPTAFGRANRVKARASRLAEILGRPERWQVEMAAALQDIGYIALPPELVEKLRAGHVLSEAEHKMVARLPVTTEQLLGHIPRLELVRGMIAAALSTFAQKVGDDPALLGGAILRVANDADAIEQSGTTGHAVVDIMRGRDRYDARVLDALDKLFGDRAPETRVVEIPLTKLKAGMVLVDDVMMNGTLLVARGYEITRSFIARLQNYPHGAIREPLRVLEAVANVS